MKIELINGLYHAELNDGRYMYIPTEVAKEFSRLQEIQEIILDIINSENSGAGHQERLNEIEKLIKSNEKDKSNK